MTPADLKRARELIDLCGRSCDLVELYGLLRKLPDEVERLQAENAELAAERDIFRANRDRLLDDRDATMSAVVAGTAERIAADIEKLGETAHPVIFKGIAERIRSGARRTEKP